MNNKLAIYLKFVGELLDTSPYLIGVNEYILVFVTTFLFLFFEVHISSFHESILIELLIGDYIFFHEYTGHLFLGSRKLFFHYIDMKSVNLALNPYIIPLQAFFL